MTLQAEMRTSKNWIARASQTQLAKKIILFVRNGHVFVVMFFNFGYKYRYGMKETYICFVW